MSFPFFACQGVPVNRPVKLNSPSPWSTPRSSVSRKTPIPQLTLFLAWFDIIRPVFREGAKTLGRARSRKVTLLLLVISSRLKGSFMCPTRIFPR